MGLKCVLLGAGNLATNLGFELKRKGYKIIQVYSHTAQSAEMLANKLETACTTLPESITRDTDVYFVVLKDSVVEEILAAIDFDNKPLIHCSGSLSLSVLKKFSENTGVLYPLQTFSKNREVNFFEIPLFIEGSSESNLLLVKSIASDLSGDVKVANSEERLIIHIAAVFANNFVNHCYTISELILNKYGFRFEILKPLIRETADKVRSLSPVKAQTGPAIRFDDTIIGRHLAVLSEDPELADLYKRISESIFKFYQKQD